jgi:hypothetical protein
MPRPFLRLLGFTLLAAPSLASVLVVAPSGAPFTEIQAAVDASSDGDVVLVRSGTYASFVIRNQELAVVADVGAVVQVAGAIRVSGVGPTRSVLLSGLKATGNATTDATKHGLFARNCFGALRVVGCELTGIPLPLGVTFTLPPTDHYQFVLPPCYGGQGAQIEGCLDVAFVGCTLRGSDAPPTNGYGGYGTRPNGGRTDGGHGLYAIHSQIALAEGALIGGRPGVFGSGDCEPAPYADPNGYVGAAGEGCRTRLSYLFASRCTFVGAPGWGSVCLDQCFCEPPSDGANALVVEFPPTSAQTLECSLSPGAGGVPNGGPCPCGIGGNFCVPSAPPGTAGSPSIGPINALAANARRLTTTSLVREGQTVTMVFTGRPGDRVELLASSRSAFHVLPGIFGVRLVGFSRGTPMLVQQVGTIGASGTLAQTWTVGDLAAGETSRITYFQAMHEDTSGQVTLSCLAPVVILDQAY